MQVTDALKEDLLNILALLEQIDAQTENALLAISSMEKNFPRSDEDRQTVDEKLKVHATLKEGYKSFLDQRAKLMEQHKVQADQFYKKVRRILNLPNASSTIMNIESLLKSKALASDQLFQKLVEREAQFDRSIGASTKPAS